MFGCAKPVIFVKMSRRQKNHCRSIGPSHQPGPSVLQIFKTELPGDEAHAVQQRWLRYASIPFCWWPAFRFLWPVAPVINGASAESIDHSEKETYT